MSRTKFPTLPSEVFQAMIDGLNQYIEDPTFQFDMESWGYWSSDNEICMGCMATAAVANIKTKGKSLNKERVDKCNFQSGSAQQIDFEQAINAMRNGLVFHPLTHYFERYNTLTSQQVDDLEDGLKHNQNHIDNRFGLSIGTDIIVQRLPEVLEHLTEMVDWFKARNL